MAASALIFSSSVCFGVQSLEVRIPTDLTNVSKHASCFVTLIDDEETVEITIGDNDLRSFASVLLEAADHIKKLRDQLKEGEAADPEKTVTLTEKAADPEKTVTLTEKNIDRAAEAKYYEVALPDCDPPWGDANHVLKSQIREAVKKTAKELFHGTGMRLEIVP